jgi:hypothetical protein
MQIRADFRQPEFLRRVSPEIPKPEPPQAEGVLGAAQKLQDRVQVSPSQSSKPTVSRDVEPPDRLAEMPVAKIDEQRRQARRPAHG